MTKPRDLGITDKRAYEKGLLEASIFLQKGANANGYKRRGETLVIGGGDEAMEAACIAARNGAEKVTVVCQEQTTEMKAAPEKISEAEALNVRIIHGWAPVRAEIHRDNRVSGVYFKHCDRLFDENGHYAPTYDERNTMAQYCDTVILADE